VMEGIRECKGAQGKKADSAKRRHCCGWLTMYGFCFSSVQKVAVLFREVRRSLRTNTAAGVGKSSRIMRSAAAALMIFNCDGVTEGGAAGHN
jgi:hypothetical protein